MAVRLIKHGTENGYREEIKTGKACERCIRAHRVFGRQYRPEGKLLGLRYGKNDVLDHLYTGRRPVRARTLRDSGFDSPAGYSAGEQNENRADGDGTGLADRLASVLSAAAGRSEYVPNGEPPEYISASEPDPDPVNSDYSSEPEEEYILNSEGRQKIEQNLGSYLSIVGMTAEMIDPYCGSILAENFDNIVKKWARIIGRYPRAARLFLDSSGGALIEWITGFQALWPVLLAVYHHHLARDVEVRDGKVYRRRNDDATVVDAVTPPMPDNFTYSAM